MFFIKLNANLTKKKAKTLQGIDQSLLKLGPKVRVALIPKKG